MPLMPRDADDADAPRRYRQLPFREPLMFSPREPPLRRHDAADAPSRRREMTDEMR